MQRGVDLRGTGRRMMKRLHQHSSRTGTGAVIWSGRSHPATILDGVNVGGGVLFLGLQALEAGGHSAKQTVSQPSSARAWRRIAGVPVAPMP
jgi:hypothetical protein